MTCSYSYCWSKIVVLSPHRLGNIFMLNPTADLPPGIFLKTSESAASSDENVTPHLMPFSIAYSGPAPVDTYFIMRPTETPNRRYETLPTEDDIHAELSEESSASFRGRYIHGRLMRLPDNYKISFCHLCNHSFDSGSAEKLSSIKKPVVRAPVRGSRFSLDEEDVEDEGTDILPQYIKGSTNTKDGPIMSREFVLSPIYPAESFFWIWNPDGPIDVGGDPFIQTCHNWLLKLAPAVSSKPLTLRRFTIRFDSYNKQKIFIL